MTFLTAALLVASQAVAQHPRLDVSADTSLTPVARWPLRIAAAGTTHVTVMLAPITPDTPPLSVETKLVRGAETFWPLRGRAGAPLDPGPYRLVVVTQDSATGLEQVRVRVLVVERMIADTQAHPPALDRTAFLPESSHAVVRRPGFLLIAGIGVATLATAWSFDEDQAISPVTVAVPGALAVGGLVGFLKGRPVSQPLPANVLHNRRLVDDDLATRRDLAGSNARAVASATWRVRVVDQP